jgi:hypothetical protein
MSVEREVFPVTLGTWFRKIRRHQDEADLRRAEQRLVQTPDERRLSEQGTEGLGPDLRAAELVRETRFDDVVRLAEGD